MDNVTAVTMSLASDRSSAVKIGVAIMDGKLYRSEEVESLDRQLLENGTEKVA